MVAFQSIWFIIHISTAFIAFASFGLASIFSIIHLINSPLPDEEAYDYKSYRLIAFGYIFLTLSIVVGTLWVKEAGSKYWIWDIRGTWSLTIWVIYSIYLHLRFHKGWKGKRIAWLAIVGFICIILTLIRKYNPM